MERLNSEEVTQGWPEPAKQAADMVMKVIGADEEKVAQYIESAGDLVKGAASFVFTQITEAEKRVQDIPDELLYADGGLSDLAMALVFRIAEDAGVEGADDPAVYAAALDEVDNLAGFTESEGEPAPEEEMPPEEEVPAEAPPQASRRPLMAQG